mgnify:CR=1 FL=1
MPRRTFALTVSSSPVRTALLETERYATMLADDTVGGAVMTGVLRSVHALARMSDAPIITAWRRALGEVTIDTGNS